MCGYHLRVEIEVDPYHIMDIRRSYCWLEEIGFDPEKIRVYVFENTGLLLPLSWPEGVSVRVASVDNFFLRKWGPVCEEGK